MPLNRASLLADLRSLRDDVDDRRYCNAGALAIARDILTDAINSTDNRDPNRVEAVNAIVEEYAQTEYRLILELKVYDAAIAKLSEDDTYRYRITAAEPPTPQAEIIR